MCDIMYDTDLPGTLKNLRNRLNAAERKLRKATREDRKVELGAQVAQRKQDLLRALQDVRPPVDRSDVDLPFHHEFERAPAIAG